MTIENIFPVKTNPCVLKIIKSQYIRDYSNPNNNRVIIKKGCKQQTIEQFALDFFEEQGYSGFFAENWFWESIISLLFFDELLTLSEYYLDGDKYYLSCIDIIKRKMDKEIYFYKLIQIKNKSNLYKFFKKQRQKYKKIIFMPETTGRYQQYCKTEDCLQWFKFLILAVESNVFIRLIDWCLESPGRTVSSMPDLMLFKKDQLAFAEIKSEKDRLNSAQSATLNFLSIDLGIEIYLFKAKEVCLKKT